MATGDRKVRVTLEDHIGCATYIRNTIAGTVLLVGCESGRIRLYDASILS